MKYAAVSLVMFAAGVLATHFGERPLSDYVIEARGVSLKDVQYISMSGCHIAGFDIFSSDIKMGSFQNNIFPAAPKGD